MSTFDGRILEFPDVRIDYFRGPRNDETRPLAYFLSHIHSDHLQGLESCKSPFIYCSSATREALLRLEKYPHRMNFARGILESRKQHYRHLKSLLKPIPLNVPTSIELAPGRSIRVTLFDANHCVGAVMFLIEDDKHAILYTGDIRAEKWWVDSLLTQPLLIPYAWQNGKQPLKSLDCIYLDTTFATQEDHHKHFPPKAEGIRELLAAVARYPSDTCFYFDAWTFGYEQVWSALSSFLRTSIHVDDYKYGVYKAVADSKDPKSEDGHKMIGYYCGNHFQQGCLTRSNTRLHSCERGTGCDVSEREFVRITPIICRHNGKEVAELGAGGGEGDLQQQHELELGTLSLIDNLKLLCQTKLQQSPDVLADMIDYLDSLRGVDSIPIQAQMLYDIGDTAHSLINDASELPIDALVPVVVQIMQKAMHGEDDPDKSITARSRPAMRADGLPSRITFPYSRHASLEELIFLIEAFRPKELYPCTVDEEYWTIENSMQGLFGHIYEADKTFRHDQEMLRKQPTTRQAKKMANILAQDKAIQPEVDHYATTPENPSQGTTSGKRRERDEVPEVSTPAAGGSTFTTSTPHHIRAALRREAWQAALSEGEIHWDEIGLASVSSSKKEQEL